MIDGVIAGNGKSRYLKSAISEDMTWEDFRAALRTGTIPADFSGFNPEGWTQVGTALNKANLLSDATETEIWGDADDRTVNQALAQLQSKVGNIETLYKKIRDVADTTATANLSIDLSDINWSTYREIYLDFEYKYSSIANNALFRINNDSGSVYAYHFQRLGNGGVTDIASDTSILGNLLQTTSAGFGKVKMRISKISAGYIMHYFIYDRRGDRIIDGYTKYTGSTTLSSLNIISGTSGDTVYLQNAMLWGMQV